MMATCYKVIEFQMKSLHLAFIYIQWKKRPYETSAQKEHKILGPLLDFLVFFQACNLFSYLLKTVWLDLQVLLLFWLLLFLLSLVGYRDTL